MEIASVVRVFHNVFELFGVILENTSAERARQFDGK